MAFAVDALGVLIAFGISLFGRASALSAGMDIKTKRRRLQCDSHGKLLCVGWTPKAQLAKLLRVSQRRNRGYLFPIWLCGLWFLNVHCMGEELLK